MAPLLRPALPASSEEDSDEEVLKNTAERPRTRSNPEGAEDRRSSSGSLSSTPPPQPAVGSRVEGEGEASSTDGAPSSTSTITTTVPIPPPAELQIRAPRVNCPEKVIICLDLSEEMSLQKLESFNGSKTNALNISQKMIEMFVRTKHKIDKRHEFALVVVNDDALWLSGFTSDPRELCSCLYDLETNVCESFTISEISASRLQKIELPLMDNVQTIPPPFVVRTLLIYSRHAGQLQFNPSDAVSVSEHELCLYSLYKDIYASFSNLDSKGMCYRFEVSLCSPAIELYNCMAKLLCHPLQRPFQSHASYSLLEGDDAQEIEATV
uniref:BRISC and BRCA1 A complex member 1 n=1 Tax=Astyanax mexicanus TaxID=7994 RepID=A0A3B1JEX1_ASTMX